MKIWIRFGLLVLLISVNSSAFRNKSRSVASISSKSAARKNSASRRPSNRQASRQAAPSSDRYREIQESLASKGYLTTPPTGVWDQNAQEALRKFQADQQLSVTGKLSSRSIIALGLGAPTSPVSPQVPSQAPPPK